ncbi:MAG: thioredoxin family protein [Bacteroidetes bacterium QH_6_64_77]|nr:MAG: thioredoxin family protein [Bacteroidetes bacterium QH_6_64_77]
MAVTESTMMELGHPAPDFSLPAANPEVDDRGDDHRSLTDYDDADVLVVVFMCNHCPYVQHIEDALLAVARTYQQRGAQFIGMTYEAACTPDIYVFDEERTLAYRGRFDETRPDGTEAHGGDLRQALDELLETGKVTMEQHPSMGCNIKWKPDVEPAHAA